MRLEGLRHTTGRATGRSPGPQASGATRVRTSWRYVSVRADRSTRLSFARPGRRASGTASLLRRADAERMLTLRALCWEKGLFRE